VAKSLWTTAAAYLEQQHTQNLKFPSCLHFKFPSCLHSLFQSCLRSLFPCHTANEGHLEGTPHLRVCQISGHSAATPHAVPGGATSAPGCRQRGPLGRVARNSNEKRSLFEVTSLPFQSPVIPPAPSLLLSGDVESNLGPPKSLSSAPPDAPPVEFSSSDSSPPSAALPYETSAAAPRAHKHRTNARSAVAPHASLTAADSQLPPAPCAAAAPS